MFVKNYKQNGFKMPLNTKNINNFTQWKNGSVDVTFTSAITHQKHLAQSRRSTRSAVDILNTHRVFTKEPIKEQEIKLESMNDSLYINRKKYSLMRKQNGYLENLLLFQNSLSPD